MAGAAVTSDTFRPLRSCIMTPGRRLSRITHHHASTRSQPMRIERIDLKIVRLPLVRPFRTSSSSKDHLDAHPRAGRDADGARRLGRVRQPVGPVLLPGDDRDLLAHPATTSSRRSSSAGSGRRSRSSSASIGRSRGTTSPRRAWRWPAGTSWRAREGRAAGRAARRHAAGDPLGRQPGHRGATSARSSS